MRVSFLREQQRSVMSGMRTARRYPRRLPVVVGDVLPAVVSGPGGRAECLSCWTTGEDTAAAVQGRAQVCPRCEGDGYVPPWQFAELEVVAVDERYMCDVTTEQAQAEGYADADTLWEAWMERYGEIRFTQRVTIVQFRVKGGAA